MSITDFVRIWLTIWLSFRNKYLTKCLFQSMLKRRELFLFKAVALPSQFGRKGDKQIPPQKLLFPRSNKNPRVFWSVYPEGSDQEITGQFREGKQKRWIKKLRGKLVDRWTRARRSWKFDGQRWHATRIAIGVDRMVFLSRICQLVYFIPRGREIKRNAAVSRIIPSTVKSFPRSC